MSQNAKLQEMVAHELSELMVSLDMVSEQELSELFEVRCGDKVYGHTDAKSLREFLIIHDEQADHLEVRKSPETQWCAFFEHPQIQRRKPQLVQNHSLESLSEDHFWLLQDGQKNGPYTSDELKEKVESCELLATDLISNDKGVSWMKVYEFEEFDRRNLQHHDLPSTPNGKVFAESLRETRIQLAQSDKEREEAEAIAGLAYIGNLRSGKGVEIERKKRRQEESPESQTPEAQTQAGVEKESAPQQLVWYALFFLSLTGTLLIFLTWNNDAPENKMKTQENVTSESQAGQSSKIAPKLEPISRTSTTTVTPTRAQSLSGQRGNTARRAIAEPGAPLQARQPQSSFRDSQAFKRAQNAPRVSGERQMADDPYVDDYFYDDGSSTFESDPVRSQLSRETIEPNLDDSWVEDMTEPEMFEDNGIEEPPFQDLFEADPY